jgi:hypothetical protein
MSNIRIHTSIVSAAAIKTVGQHVVSVSWKQTKNQTRKERAIVLPMECVSAPEVVEQFRVLVESALKESAEQVLKRFVDDNGDMANEVGEELFTRPNLTESFMSRADNWMTKEQLETAFMQSETWKKIAARPDFSTNPAVFKAATHYKETILKLSGKATKVEAKLRDSILSKMDASDLETELGAFILRRFDQMAKGEKTEEIDLSAL